MAVANAAYAAVHDSSAATTNPTANDVIGDTGAMAKDALYECRILVGSSVAGVWALQHRNAANDGIVSETVTLRSAAGQTAEYVLKYHLKTSERLRLLYISGGAGVYESTIQAIKVA